MAIMRCRDHEPKRATRDYVAAVEPVGYPGTALICGSVRCTRSALIWLEHEEKLAFDRGQRIFESFTATTKVRAAEAL